MNKNISNILGPYNQYTYFIGPNPPTLINPYSITPQIDDSVFIGPFSSIIGDITIREKVFIGCNVTIRADEGTPFFIGSNTNLQDGVILHGLEKKYVIINHQKYSIYIGNKVSCAHNCIVHGPCFIGDNTFIGVKAVVFNAFVHRNCFIGTGAIITDGVVIDKGKFIPPGSIIDTQEKADSLGPVTKNNIKFSEDIISANTEFSSAYNILVKSIHDSN